MLNLRCCSVRSLLEFQEIRSEWEDLYSRSTSHRCTGQHAAVQAFWQSFLVDDKVEIVLVREAANQQLVACIPLVQKRWIPGLTQHQNFSNPWSPGLIGVFSADVPLDRVWDAVLQHLVSIGSSMLALSFCSDEAPELAALLRLQQQQQRQANVQSQFDVGKTLLDGGWDDFTRSWSKSRRKFIRRASEQLAEQGDYQMVRVHELPLGEIQRRWEACLEVEAAGWKGEATSSILQDQQARRYFEHLLTTLVGSGELLFYTLEMGTQIIAYDFGFQKNRVATSLKVSYDSDYRDYSPGHVLNSLVVQDMLRSNEIDWIDTVGELNEANSKWCVSNYTAVKVETALDSWSSRWVVGSRQWLRALKQRYAKGRHVQADTAGPATNDTPAMLVE